MVNVRFRALRALAFPAVGVWRRISAVALVPLEFLPNLRYQPALSRLFLLRRIFLGCLGGTRLPFKSFVRNVRLRNPGRDGTVAKPALSHGSSSENCGGNLSGIMHVRKGFASIMPAKK